MQKTLIIDEKFWNRANKGDETHEGMLNNKAGKMCCLGFVGQACGVGKKEMLRKNYPSDLAAGTERVSAEYPWLFDGFSYSRDAHNLASINDDHKLTVAEKRKQIKEIFAANGVKVVFKRA